MASASERGEPTAALLRERIYGDIACVSSLIVLAEYENELSGAWAAVLQVTVSSAGLWAAATLAEFVAVLGVRGRAPRGADLAHLVGSTWQILEAAVLPVLLLVLAAVHVLSLHAAIRAGIVVLVATLGLFALLAARRTALAWWGRVLLVLALMGLGALVVLLKTLGH